MNSTIAGNYAVRYGGGTYGAGTITNSILWANTAGTSGSQIYSSPTVTYSDIQSGFTGTGNISGDPLLINVQQATNGNPTTAGNFHISLFISPAVNAAIATGAPVDDIDGDIRPSLGGYDMGADEYL